MKQKPTKSQIEVLNKMQPGVWYSAYELQCGLNTLEGLYNRRLVLKKAEIGYLYSPRNSIMYKKPADKDMK